MCKKCGIGSCGSCSGKATKFLTGEMFYDGEDVACLDEYGFVSGDSLNSILQSIGTVACANKAFVDPINFNFHDSTELVDEVLGAEQPTSDYPLGSGYLFAAADEGLFEIIRRFILSFFITLKNL